MISSKYKIHYEVSRYNIETIIKQKYHNMSIGGALANEYIELSDSLSMKDQSISNLKYYIAITIADSMLKKLVDEGMSEFAKETMRINVRHGLFSAIEFKELFKVFVTKMGMEIEVTTGLEIDANYDTTSNSIDIKIMLNSRI